MRAILYGKSRVLIVFLHEIACFPHVPGVLFLHICTHKDLAAPRVGLSWSRSVFRRHCLCMVYGRCGGLYRVQRRHVREGWPPGLFASTTGEQINGIAQDRQSGPLFSMLQMPNDGSPCRASDAFSRGVVQFSEDRRNLERFRATAGRWQCYALRGLAARAVCLNGRGTDQRDNGKRRPGTCWCVLNEWNNFRALVGVLVREISNLSNK